MIEFKNVYKSYKPKKGSETIALDNVSLALSNVGLVFLVGKSGSGKSTLLNVLGGLDKIDQGEILINNKNLNLFKNCEMDAYRNTYLGFIFQEFNLIDGYNVYENVEISLNLQKKKAVHTQTDRILQTVGIENLGYRKVNELSGGQKQRVAIARAIIKNPNIILADEPTGNLDSQTSEQIFELLKNISKERLVVIVTHDLEYAQKYGDRIIELSDGKIVSDKLNNNILITHEELNLISSKIPFAKLFKLASVNLRSKKIKLTFTMLLVTIALSFFGFASTLTYFNIPRTHAETMVKEKNSQISINKRIEGFNFTSISPVITFTNSEVEEMKIKLNNEVTKVSRAVENNSYLNFNFAKNTIKDITEKNYAYYDLNDFEYVTFLNYSDEKLNELKIIGNLPNNDHEVLIHKTLADYFIKNGMTTLKENKKIKTEEDYFPKTYEDIISSKKKIVFGTSYLMVSGIINEDISKYEILKTVLSDEMQINPTLLYEEFVSKYQKTTYELITSNTFFETLDLVKNNTLSIDFYKPVYNFDNRQIYTQSITSVLNNEINIFNGKKNVKINQIKENEIIISQLLLDELYNYEYTNKLLEYLKDKKEEFELQLKEREELIKERETKLENNPELVLEEIPELEPFDAISLQAKYLLNYVKEKEIIGKTINIEINDMYLRTQEQKVNKYDNLLIVGIELNGYTNYLSENILNSYMRENNETIYIDFNESDVKKLEKIFKTFPQKDAKYTSKTIYSESIVDVEVTVNNIKKISYYLTIVFLVFAILLFMNFITTSINSNKKEIGILRSLGTKKIDVFKIYFLEGLLIALFSFLMSSIICKILSILTNEMISKNLFFDIRPVIFRIDLILYLLLVTFGVVLISSIVPIIKLTKMKPIDAIGNK